MTSLKVRYADEIMDAMAKQLQDESFVSLFKTAELKKEAGSALEAYKAALGTVKNKAELDAAWAKHHDSVLQEENKEEGVLQKMTCLQTAKARELGLPGYATPGCADDAPATCECDENMQVAAEFAIENLVKIADALDTNGYADLANFVDEAMQKIASKKKPGRGFKGWVKFLEKQKGPVNAFKKTYKGALEHAKEKGMDKAKAEEYAMRTALDKLPKKYIDKPSKVHGPGKSGPLTKKRK